MAEWNDVASRLVRCNIQYPRDPRARDVPAGGVVVVVKFDVSADGYVGPISAVRSSGIAVFDEAALVAVKLSSPCRRLRYRTIARCPCRCPSASCLRRFHSSHRRSLDRRAGSAFAARAPSWISDPGPRSSSLFLHRLFRKPAATFGTMA
ncbi:energy transducer TonB [Methylorubrum aminovorans]|uniref:energy transducer TonB n=1 Tax=Methylorubrum aminovorans TaxID=269069 RepID=UPI003D675D50